MEVKRTLEIKILYEVEAGKTDAECVIEVLEGVE